nr:type II secretion system F family protein [uncultured Moellerella sp.]
MKLIYAYSAITLENEVIKDILLSHSKKQAYQLLIDKQLVPLKIRLKNIMIIDNKTTEYSAYFFHQISMLMKSGITLLKSLNIILSSCSMAYWKIIITEMIHDIEQGILFSHSLQKYSKIFDKITLNLVAISEKTGDYSANFERIFQMLDSQQKIKKKIIRSLRYPLTLVIFSLLALFLMLNYVLPQFELVYANFNSELPLLTQKVIDISNLFKKNNATTLVTLTTLLLAAYWLNKKNRKTKLVIHKILTSTPKIKILVQLKQLKLYFTTLSITLESELPLLECLQSAIGSVSNQYYKKESQIIYHNTILGYSLSQSLKQSSLFPDICFQFTHIGEESGKLAHFIHYLSHYYQEQYLQKIERLLKNLEPIIMLIMAILIGNLLLAMYLPIFNLGNVFS